MRGGEVDGGDGVGEGAESFGGKRLGFGAKQEAGGGGVFLHEFEGVEVIGCGENPGGWRRSGRGVGGELEVGGGGESWRFGVGGSYEDGLIGKGGCEVGESDRESFRGERAEGDKQGGRGAARIGRGGVLGDGGGGGHSFKVRGSRFEVRGSRFEEKQLRRF
jgi:hypothetical protein